MCGCSEGCGCRCQRPEKQAERSTECTPEQIRECHGEVTEHPCEQEPITGR